jgi:hypothetical protein
VTDLWRRGLKVGVDKNVSLRRDDEVCGQVAAADVVEVAGDLERVDGRGPVLRYFGGESGDDEKEGESEAAHDVILAACVVSRMDV